MTSRPERRPASPLPMPPGSDDLCATCGVVLDRHHPWSMGRGGGCALGERRQRWAEGWVDLAAFGLPDTAADGWPQLRNSRTFEAVHGGLGLVGFRTAPGRWVRHDDPDLATAPRVAALAVLLAGGVALDDAVARVVEASPGDVGKIARPECIVIETPGCGDRHHRVEVRKGIAEVQCGFRVKYRYRPREAQWTFRSPATCAEVTERWNAGDAGRVVLDTTLPTPNPYRRVGHDPAVLAGLRVMAAACIARYRCHLIEIGEPDRFLRLDYGTAPVDAPVSLLASTRGLPAAVIEAHPRWLWAAQPLQLVGFAEGGTA